MIWIIVKSRIGPGRGLDLLIDYHTILHTIYITTPQQLQQRMNSWSDDEPSAGSSDQDDLVNPYQHKQLTATEPQIIQPKQQTGLPPKSIDQQLVKTIMNFVIE